MPSSITKHEFTSMKFSHSGETKSTGFVNFKEEKAAGGMLLLGESYCWH